ncbi:short-chain dehydrogenase TIC 32 [Coleophoma cylindrospora]|uniref:Short-chain dehydrogenase TIC 32 n=1 Tax=Coleophoma cylindrospora TaxID=1849047 RepID=A0A3D8QVZ5_9HELO|nr:short-chain dehydrogenase TIC 32 [Coleophoma cylindrospora]
MAASSPPQIQFVEKNPPGNSASSLVLKHADQIKGKVILTTGISPGGLGFFFLQAVVKAQPRILILAGRSTSKSEAAARLLRAESSAVEIRILELDLSSLAAVRTAAATVNGWHDIPNIDILVNNAGVMAVDYSITVDGYESQFAANHLGHFLLTNLIMDKILASKAPRIVAVSSDGHRLSPIRFEDYNFHNGDVYNRWKAYGQSKTANMLMALSLATKLGAKRNLLAFSLHPGIVMTNLGSHLNLSIDFDSCLEVDRDCGYSCGWKTTFEYFTPDEGAATHIYAAFDQDIAAHNGSYLTDCQIGDPLTGAVHVWATSHVEAERLWKLSEKLVGQEFNY